MIICPSCKEEIEDGSHYCDQCGQELVYCESCGRVGMGRRCTFCGGLMVSAEKLAEQRSAKGSVSSATQSLFSSSTPSFVSQRSDGQSPGHSVVPTLTLYNPSLDIRIVGINGAIIGRRQGPYQQMFVNNMYISGVHAQLIFKPDTGWCIIDKHSSNGTKLNQRDILPDVPMTIKAGDIVSLANVTLQVSINE